MVSGGYGGRNVRPRRRALPLVPPDRIDDVIAALQRGEVVSIPTDTVYGLAASLDDLAAVRRLAEMKGRAVEQPIAVLIDSADVAASHLDDRAALDRVARHWPGALTAIVRVRDSTALPDPVLSVDAKGSKTLGLRVPDDDLARAVIRACGGALAVTSANRHDEAPATSAAEVASIFGDDLIVLDGGSRDGGVSSTVVDLTVDPPGVLREGAVSAGELSDQLK
ncbi:MAG: L-threonylcarbamoyladenylate synthase [Dehalococcoidia bacterium]